MASDFSIRHAAHIINHGGVIAYPTDTIYGLGCDPYNYDAVEKVNRIKQRPLNKRFILLAGEIEQIKPLILISEEQEKTITQNAEPTSWVVDASPQAPSWLIDDQNTLTIRISNHHDVKRLCQALGHAIISTSANISGKKPAKNALELHKYFHQSVDKILLSSKNKASKASKIIRLCDNYVIRH
jgi:L-threonylcarbamoyladenylate synthase